MNAAVDGGLPIEKLLGDPGDEADQLDLVRYWRAIRRNLWRILALMATVGILAAMVASGLPPVYRSVATILVETGKPKIVSFEDVYTSWSTPLREHYLTQLEILKSRELAAKLVRQLKLAQHPEFKPGAKPKPFYEQWLPRGFFGADGADATDDQVEAGVIHALQRDINSQLVRNSQLIRISYDSRDPELAAAVPNALAEIFIQADLDGRMQMNRKASAFLTSQTADLKKRVGEAEQALQLFREREKIIDTKTPSQAGTGSQIETLTSSLIEARRRRNEAEYAYQQVTALGQGKSQEALESVPAIQKHPQVLRLREAEAEAEKRYADAAKRYGAEHPRLVAAESELKLARENAHRGLAGAVQTVTREYESARANEAAIERTLNGVKSEVQNLNRKEFQLAALEREVIANRQFYDLFMRRNRETAITGEIHNPIARVVDPATVPSIPFGPNQRLIVTLSLLAALLTGISLALLLERLDNTVKSSHEVESRLGVPALGVLNITKVKSGVQIERAFLDDPQTSFSEAIRTIRSSVMLSAIDTPRKIVLVTSSIPEEGKTTVASNLAFAIGQVKKTLLIDADMRRPSIGYALGGADSKLIGLSQLVAGEAPLERCIYPVAHGSQDLQGLQLSVLPAGRVPPNPLELLVSNSFATTMQMLSEIFEIIVIDSAPVQLVSDALVLSTLASEVIYVVKADATPYPLARRGLRRLRRVKAPVLGVVLNRLDPIRADRYYGEYSGYGKRYYNKKYGYGYTGEKE